MRLGVRIRADRTDIKPHGASLDRFERRCYIAALRLLTRLRSLDRNPKMASCGGSMQWAMLRKAKVAFRDANSGRNFMRHNPTDIVGAVCALYDWSRGRTKLRRHRLDDGDRGGRPDRRPCLFPQTRQHAIRLYPNRAA